MVHILTRNGLSGGSYSSSLERLTAKISALHTDLTASLDRMSFSPSPQAATAPAAAFFTKRIPAHRHKQVRISMSIRGIPRLPPHNVSHLYK